MTETITRSTTRLREVEDIKEVLKVHFNRQEGSSSTLLVAEPEIRSGERKVGKEDANSSKFLLKKFFNKKGSKALKEEVKKKHALNKVECSTRNVEGAGHNCTPSEPEEVAFKIVIPWASNAKKYPTPVITQPKTFVRPEIPYIESLPVRDKYFVGITSFRKQLLRENYNRLKKIDPQEHQEDTSKSHVKKSSIVGKLQSNITSLFTKLSNPKSKVSPSASKSEKNINAQASHKWNNNPLYVSKSESNRDSMQWNNNPLYVGKPVAAWDL